MAQHKPTPEEQLLKLIENPREHQKSETRKQESAATDVKKKFLFPGGFLKNLFPKKTGGNEERNARKRIIIPVLSLRLVNRVLFVLFFAAGIYLVLDIFILKQDDSAFLAQVSTTDTVLPAQALSLGQVKEWTYHEERLNKRNPFLPAETEIKENIESNMNVASTVSTGLSKALQSLELVGISWSEEEPLAMIEDTTSGRTYFLSRGQKIRDVKIQSISKDKVIVTREGEEATLV